MSTKEKKEIYIELINNLIKSATELQLERLYFFVKEYIKKE